MKRAHKIRIYPNNKQQTMLLKHCGCARLAYNVCLSKWNDDYADGIKHNYFSIKKWFNSVKRERYPFVYEVSKWAMEAAIKDLETGFLSFYRKTTNHPRFHKKGVRDSFRIDGSVIKVDGETLTLPKGLSLRMAEELRYDAQKIYNVTVSRRADKWYVSIQVEIADIPSENQAGIIGIVGVDLGINRLATLSDGTEYPNIGVEPKYRKRLRMAQKSLARKDKGSKNWHKAQIRLARLYERMSNTRSDNTHKLTTEVAGKYGIVCLEDLNVSGMLANHKLARSIADVSFYEVRRQFEYKAQGVWYVSRYAPTSKACSGCGKVHDMPLSKREMICDCRLCIDRDLNAAINIVRWASPDTKPVDKEALAM